MNKEEYEKKRFYNACKRKLNKIIAHPNYDYCNIGSIARGLLQTVGQADSYNDLPNCDIIGMLDNIYEQVRR